MVRFIKENYHTAYESLAKFTQNNQYILSYFMVGN